MSYPASEKLEIIRLVERSHLQDYRGNQQLRVPITSSGLILRRPLD